MKGRLGVPWVGVALAVLGLAVLLLGVWRGETAVVFAKAVRICLECIGIG